MSNLPVECLAEILSHLSVYDVLRAASVNRTWAAAAFSHIVWDAKLRELPAATLCLLMDIMHFEAGKSPRGDARISASYNCDAASQMIGGPSSHSTKTDQGLRQARAELDRCYSEPYWTYKTVMPFYRVIWKGIVSENGAQRLTVDSSGALRLDISAASSLQMWWGPYHGGLCALGKSPGGSPFTRVERVPVVQAKFLLQGTINCRLPPGQYSVAWRLAQDAAGGDPKLDPHISFVEGMWGISDKWQAQSIVKETNGQQRLAASKLMVSPESIAVVPCWTEIQVAEINIKPLSTGGGGKLCHVELGVQLYAIKYGWKSALYVDSIVLKQTL